MNRDIIKSTLSRSLAGTIAFPEVVETLLNEGVESYHVDLVAREERFYGTNGEFFVEKMDLPALPIATELNAVGLVAAIRDSQAGKIVYRQFVERATAAGTSYYIAFLKGRKVTYFGRQGYFHEEKFPQLT